MPGSASENKLTMKKKRSIPITELEKLAASWEGWANTRLEEHKQAPTPKTCADSSARSRPAAEPLMQPTAVCISDRAQHRTRPLL
jgi:hypothetical protein